MNKDAKMDELVAAAQLGTLFAHTAMELLIAMLPRLIEQGLLPEAEAAGIALKLRLAPNDRMSPAVHAAAVRVAEAFAEALNTARQTKH